MVFIRGSNVWSRGPADQASRGGLEHPLGQEAQGLKEIQLLAVRPLLVNGRQGHLSIADFQRNQSDIVER
jgi:hypothetical protein